MERKTKKVKKEGDTCRDCWTKRFRKDMHKQWQSESKEIPFAPFLNRELQAREDAVKQMREEFGDLYDEISAIQDLAGDTFMGRLEKDAEED